MNTTTNNKMVEITYNGLNFTLDFTKKGVPDVYFKGKLLRPIFNRKLGRNHFSICLPKAEYEGYPGTYISANGYGVIYHVFCYRLIAAGMEKLRTGEFDYEKFKGMQVDHIDSCSNNDNPSNLRWTTRKRNNSRKHARQMKSMNYKNVRHDNQIVKVTNLSTGKVELYKNAMRASKAIGCSHVLVYRCLNPYDYATTAYGHKVEYVPLTYGILDGEMNNVENA